LLWYSNHDFYWEGGKPSSERRSGEAPGPRDRFFHNINNKPFFPLFKKIYPWNGRRWIQVNINALQSKKLIDDNGFSFIRTCSGSQFYKQPKIDIF